MNGTEITNPRDSARKRLLNKIDPLFWILDRWIFESLFRPSKKNVPGEYEELDYADADFLVENLLKHRFILWLNIILAVYMILFGLAAIFKMGKSELVITGLLAPAVITGGAWYNLTFGGISEKFLGTAMRLTRWMFLAFSLSMTLLMALLCYLSPWPVAFVLGLIYIGLYVASILYDNVDGLKIGLDTTMLRFSRASLNYYQKHGLLTREETQQTEFFTLDKSEQIALFTYHITMVEHGLEQLGERRDLNVANHLIASSLNHLFHAIEDTLSEDEKIDKGNENEYISYVTTAHEMSQNVVDEKTIFYLEKAIGALDNRLEKKNSGKEARSELASVGATLEQFKAIRASGLKVVRERDAKEKEKLISEGKDPESALPQSLADHLFIQIFQQLLSLIKAHRHLFFRS
ncbi:MAG TPA: hypothetical protein VH988_17190 [Thermoanaerobaculia bacterium]|jgi:hypothetical protein|nr:hypothetical protein [Thermoanaerobaculia bacterium]